MLPEEEAKPGYILIKTGLWEEAQVHIRIVGIVRIPLFPRRYFVNIEKCMLRSRSMPYSKTSTDVSFRKVKYFKRGGG